MRGRNLKENIFKKVKVYAKILFVLFSLSLSFSVYRNIQKIRGAEEKIKQAELEVEEIESEGKALQERLNDVRSLEYMESQLRDKLGMSKEGEIVVVLPEDSVVRRYAPSLKVEERVESIPNWRMWANLFL